jgi:hypothetical protein
MIHRLPLRSRPAVRSRPSPFDLALARRFRPRRSTMTARPISSTFTSSGPSARALLARQVSIYPLLAVSAFARARDGWGLAGGREVALRTSALIQQSTPHHEQSRTACPVLIPWPPLAMSPIGCRQARRSGSWPPPCPCGCEAPGPSIGWAASGREGGGKEMAELAASIQKSSGTVQANLFSLCRSSPRSRFGSSSTSRRSSCSRSSTSTKPSAAR